MKLQNKNYIVRGGTGGSKEIEFTMDRPSKLEKMRLKNEEHQRKRKGLVRSTKMLKGKLKFNKPL